MIPVLSDLAPLFGCWINQDWQTAGMAYVAVVRKMKTGLLMFAVFYLDIIKHRIENSYASVGVTEERFRKSFLQDSEIAFFQVELDLIKDLIAQQEIAMQDRGEPLPENYLICAKLLGPRNLSSPASDTMIKIQNSIASSTNGMAAPSPDLVYRAKDREIVETELRQIEFVEESQDSTQEQRKFIWQENKTKGLRFRKEKETVAHLVLDAKELSVYLVDPHKKEHFDLAILQYLGSLVESKK